MLKPRDKKPLKPATLMVHGGTTRSGFGETSEALFLTQGFVYPTAEAAESRFNGDEPGFIYSRYANPTNRMFEERMMALEGAEDARGTASGMAAVAAAIQCQVKAGDHIVAARALFGSCRYVVETVMARCGVDCTLIDGRDLDQWQKAVRPNTKVFFMETPTNPTLEVIDIAAVAEIAHAAGATLVVDNVFATPIHQKPLDLGADVVVYSATKHIDGQGRCLGGVILSSKDWIDENLHQFYRHTGPALSPFNAWTLLKGLETLPLRVVAQTAAAATVADRLAERSEISRVLYPHREDHPDYAIAKRQMAAGSTLVAFGIAGGKAAAFRFLNALEIILISNNLGDAKSLVTHPATTTHKNLSAEAQAELGIDDGLIRLSLGLEDVEDLWDDIEAALSAV
ncbi:O-succinylhomoserine sulfhydrylase [Jiella pacifica]|uniref:O-succinylhomoserine sulfhydrylase n=1 Tax=Jiella pacifica TaxID=2696469 RepID=A0A6N9SZY6_9HYPH|nr:O-succinylhomoserine sulfhydrylase [Jiella pacifica]NDW03346.1 O-succinylhomoserine sulfhydrylase [Jiella pacifica]